MGANNFENYFYSILSDLNEVEAFVGKMAYLDIWDRALTGFEVFEMFNECTPFQGNLYAWSEFRSQVSGSIKVNYPFLHIPSVKHSFLHFV